MNNTPLRYPGGKSIMTSFFETLIQYNSLTNINYSEPYAGGAGTAINLLLKEKVDSICINDAAIGIYSFWKAITDEGTRFMELLSGIEVNLSEWQRQRKIFKEAKKESFELGFATFFLSRTNRSGILWAGPIGGQDENGQRNATYKIDCRFNKNELLERISRIFENRERIFVSNLDALDFLHSINNSETLVYLDPPYYIQGEALYLNYYKHQDHVKLSKYLKCANKFNWVLSYDNVPEILELYADYPLYQFDLNYTAQDVKKGSELITHSHKIEFPILLTIRKSRSNDTSLLSITTPI